MQTIEQYQAYMLRNDYGMMFLALMTLAAVVLALVLYRRWAGFRRVTVRFAPYALNLATATANPLVGLLTIGSSVPTARALRYRWALHIVLVGAVLVRLPGMFQSLWYDEAFTARIASLDFLHLFPAIFADVHPPLYYTLIWFWARLIELFTGGAQLVGWLDAALLRLPSLAFGLLGVVLMHRLCLALGLSRRVAVRAALLMAITPAAIYYSNELRSYSLMVCAVLGALICLLEDRPRGFVLSTALIAWCHNLGLMYCALLCVGALVYHWNRAVLVYFSLSPGESRRVEYVAAPFARWSWLITVIAAGLLSLLFLPLMLNQMGAIDDGFWITFNAGTPFWVLALNLMYVPREYLLPLLLPMIGLGAASFWVARDFLRTAPGALLLALIVGVPAFGVVVSLVWDPVFLPRVFLPVTLLALIPLAVALDRYRAELGRIAGPLFLVALLVFYGNSQLTRPDYRSMVGQGCAGASAMYYTAIDTAITVAPEWSGESLVWAEGRDRGLTFLADDLPLLGFELGDIAQFAGRRVCVVYILTPRTLQPERDYVAELVARYPHETQTFNVHPSLVVDVYQFDV